MIGDVLRDLKIDIEDKIIRIYDFQKDAYIIVHR